MRKNQIVLALLGLFFSISAFADVSFRDYSLDKAVGVAKIEERNIVVSFSADWCLPCKLLEQGAFKDDRLTGFMNHEFVNVKAMYEKGTDKEWFERFKVVDLPVILILDKKGNEVKRIQGLLTTEILYNTFQQYQDGGTPLVPIDFQQQYKDKYNIKDFDDLRNAKRSSSETAEKSVVLQFARCSSLKAAKKKFKKLRKKDISTIILEEKWNGKYSYSVIFNEQLTFKEANMLFKKYSSKRIECFVKYGKAKKD